MVDPPTFSAKQRRDQQAFANRRDRAAEPWPPATALVGTTNTTGRSSTAIAKAIICMQTNNPA
jgi:hypothetical protein